MQQTLAQLDKLYDKERYWQSLTRADFYALVGIYAVEAGVFQSIEYGGFTGAGTAADDDEFHALLASGICAFNCVTNSSSRAVSLVHSRSLVRLSD